jgi:hypothetical protein
VAGPGSTGRIRSNPRRPALAASAKRPCAWATQAVIRSRCQALTGPPTRSTATRSGASSSAAVARRPPSSSASIRQSVPHMAVRGLRARRPRANISSASRSRSSRPSGPGLLAQLLGYGVEAGVGGRLQDQRRLAQQRRAPGGAGGVRGRDRRVGAASQVAAQVGGPAEGDQELAALGLGQRRPVERQRGPVQPDALLIGEAAGGLLGGAGRPAAGGGRLPMRRQRHPVPGDLAEVLAEVAGEVASVASAAARWSPARSAEVSDASTASRVRACTNGSRRRRRPFPAGRGRSPRRPAGGRGRPAGRGSPRPGPAGRRGRGWPPPGPAGGSRPRPGRAGPRRPRARCGAADRGASCRRPWPGRPRGRTAGCRR